MCCICANMGAKESIYQKANEEKYYKITPHHHAEVKKIWETIEKNLTTYGNGFFVSVCEKFPEFTKYFSKQMRPPIDIDAHMAAKYTFILENIGYILLDCYGKPKQISRSTGYTAMVHKDMNLTLQDFLNFSHHIVDYLASIFPAEMSLECQEDLKEYLTNISQDIVSKIKDFRKYEIMDLEEPARFLSCNPCLTSNNNLIFGQTLLYWKDRKRRWDNKINEWENSRKSIDQTVVSSTDEESTAYKSKTEDELSEWAIEPVLSFDRQGLHRRTQMLTPDFDSTTYGETNGKKTETSYSDLHIASSTLEGPRQAGNLKKPGSQSEKLYIPKHVTVKTDIKKDILVQNLDELRKRESTNLYTPRQRFRSRSSYERNFEIPTKDVSNKLKDVQRISTYNNPEITKDVNTATISARQRRRMRVRSLNR